MNKVISLVGEDPNDTLSIRYLLEKRISVKVSYELLIRHKRGHQLDNERTKESLKIECKRKNPDLIIFIRDADGIYTQHDKIEKCNKWHKELSKELNTPNILLLNIYELEALIFADIDVFNSIYKTSIKGNRDVTYIKEPKEELIKHTLKQKKKYSESDCPDIFKQLNIDNVIKKCGYFRQFYEALVQAVGEQHVSPVSNKT